MTKIVRTVKSVRGPFGKIVKWLFIGFNLLMAFWLFSYWGKVAPMIGDGTGAQQAGAAIGSTIGTGIVLMFWGLGVVILGILVLLTKGKQIIIEETIEPGQPFKATQDTVTISEAAMHKYTQVQPDNNNGQSKFTSSFKLTLQYGGFALLALAAIGMVSSSFMGALCILIAGALLLPQVQTRLVNTPLKSRAAIGIAVFCMIVLSSLLSTEGKTSATQIPPVQAQSQQQKLEDEAKKSFADNPEKVLKELYVLSTNKDWFTVKTKTETLLVTGNSDIKSLHDHAVAELAKVEEEKKSQDQARLTTEFKEKREALLVDLKKQIASENYEAAERVGSDYISVADTEFKGLHDTAAKKQAGVREKQAAEASAAPWSYSQDDDPMSKGKNYFASLSSTNTVEFGFPYSGAQHGTLVLRTNPRQGKDVIFSIEKGQILCPSYGDGCTVLVRFDDDDPVSFSASGPNDNSSETAFIQNYPRFLEKMMKAKRVRISVNIYQQGAPVFDFDVSGFNHDKYKPKT